MTEKTYHFLACNAALWRALPDLRKIIKAMDKEKMTYQIWWVPLPHDADYEIRFYKPQVEGAVFLGTYDPKEKA